MSLRHWQINIKSVDHSERLRAGCNLWPWSFHSSVNVEACVMLLKNISAQKHRLYHLGSTKLSRSSLSRIN